MSRLSFRLPTLLVAMLTGIFALSAAARDMSPAELRDAAAEQTKKQILALEHAAEKVKASMAKIENKESSKYKALEEQLNKYRLSHTFYTAYVTFVEADAGMRELEEEIATQLKRHERYETDAQKAKMQAYRDARAAAIMDMREANKEYARVTKSESLVYPHIQLASAIAKRKGERSN